MDRRIPWRSRILWQRLGYGLTALWMIGVLAVTREDVHHPLFEFIFIVPLTGWILGLLVAAAIARLWPPPQKADRGRQP